jgi:hypothetical protein
MEVNARHGIFDLGCRGFSSMVTSRPFFNSSTPKRPGSARFLQETLDPDAGWQRNHTGKDFSQFLHLPPQFRAV